MADQLTVTGKFLGAKATETVGANGLTVRKFYLDVTTNPDWPETPEFQLRGDKVALVDNLTKGVKIQVSFNLKGRKFTNKSTGAEGIITSVEAWKIDVVTVQSAAVAAPKPAGPSAFAVTDGGLITGKAIEEEPLPF